MRSAIGAFAFFAAHLIVSEALAAETQIVVNAVPLTAETVRKLKQLYPVPIKPGRYWYDGFSGAWGFEGGPAWFDLSRCGQQQRSSGGSSTRTFCDPDGSCRSSGLWGSILTTPR